MSKKFLAKKIFRVIIYLLAVIFIIISIYNITLPSANQFRILLLCIVACIILGVMLIQDSNGKFDLSDAIVVFVFMLLGREVATLFNFCYFITIQFIEKNILGKRPKVSRFYFTTSMFVVTTYVSSSITNYISNIIHINKTISKEMLSSIGTISMMPIVLIIFVYVSVFLFTNISIYKIDYFLGNAKKHSFGFKGSKLIFLNFLLSVIIGSTLYIIEGISEIVGTILIFALLVLCNYGIYISTKLQIKNEAIKGLVKITSDIVKYGDFREKSINLIKNLQEFIPYNVCAFYMFNIDDQALTYPIAYTGPENMDIGELGFDLSKDAITIKKVREGKIYVSKDIRRDKELSIHGKSLSVCITMILVPVIVDKKVSALILLGGDGELGDFMDSGMEEILNILSNQLSLAIENDMAYKEVNNRAYIDELSKLYNRRAFENEINMLISKDTKFSLVMYDIDNFKLINDTYGHLAGDEVIKNISNTIKRSIRKTDIACRYGGEEIAVIFKGLSKEDAFIISDRIRNNIQDTDTLFKNKKITVTVSGGVAAYPQDAKTRDEIIKRADETLYIECKQKGKNKVCTYN